MTRIEAMGSGGPTRLELQRLVEGALSTRSRLGHVALLLGALLVTAGVGSLWLTEPSLPARTHAAFAAVVAIGLAWTGYAAAVLARRRPLLARHRIAAGRMAVLFTSLFTIGALALGSVNDAPAANAAAATGGVLLVAAIAALRRAHVVHARLVARREELERELRAPRPRPE